MKIGLLWEFSSSLPWAEMRNAVLNELRQARFFPSIRKNLPIHLGDPLVNTWVLHLPCLCQERSVLEKTIRLLIAGQVVACSLETGCSFSLHSFCGLRNYDLVRRPVGFRR